MRNRTDRLVAGLALLALPCVAGIAVPSAVEPSDPATWEALDQELEEVFDELGLPGLAVGIVRDGQVAYVRGFGVGNLETREPVTDRSLFHLASVSKTFVATAVMQLVDEGKIDLDEPVVTYLPYFRLDDERYSKITVRHMLSHTSGMPDVRDYEWDAPETGDEALEQYVRGLRDRKLLSDPGEEFSYSNMAYEVLGDVVAKVSGESFEQYLKEKVLDPLGMTTSTFLFEETEPGLRTSPHVGYPDPSVCGTYPYNRIHAPSSTLQSSAREMCNWLLAQLGRGVLGETRILEKASHDELWRSHVATGRGRSIGLGWFLETQRDRRCVLHGGADEGYQSVIMLFPDDSTGVVILANCTKFRMRELKTCIIDRIFAESR